MFITILCSLPTVHVLSNNDCYCCCCCCCYYYYNGLFSTTTWVSQYQKGKTGLDLSEARDDGVLGCSGISWTICKNLHLAPER